MLDFNAASRSNEMVDLSTTKRCVIYARCSTLFQEDSIESQIAFNEEFAAQNGLTVVGYFRDDGKSGRNDNREGLKALMEELQNPQREWDLVLVYRLDRFFRNARLFMEYQYTLLDSSVYLLSAQESMLNNIFPMTLTFRFFVAQQAELESKRIGENIARGKLTSAQKGNWQGGTPPLGYDVLDNALIINPQEKTAVAMIFELRAQGVSLEKIANTLNDKGYLSKLKRQFKSSSIRELLTNPCYKGEAQYNRSSAKGINGFNRHSYKNDEFIVKHSCPAIVSEELWNSVQPTAKNKARSSKSTRYLLSGKVLCKHCTGQTMHANRRNNHNKLYISYYCPNNKSHLGCPTKEIDMQKLEEFVLSCLGNALLSQTTLAHFTKEFSNLNQKKKAELAELTAHYTRIDRRCRNIISELENNNTEEIRKELSTRLDKIAKEKHDLEKNISDLKKTMSYIPSKTDVDTAKTFFISYCNHPENRPFVETLVRNNVERIEVGTNSIEVFLNC